MKYPYSAYFERWYHDTYKHRDPENFTFWDFIKSVRKHIGPSGRQELSQIYRRYFIGDYRKEREKRLVSEIWTWLEGNATAFNRYPEDNATERIQIATKQMLKPDIPEQDFDEYWEDIIQKPFMLNIPEDDILPTFHVLSRVHTSCCDIHQIIFDTKYTLQEMTQIRKSTWKKLQERNKHE